MVGCKAAALTNNGIRFGFTFILLTLTVVEINFTAPGIEETPRLINIVKYRSVSHPCQDVGLR
jgi:hypothetical protein